MTITVKLFAAARDAAGREVEAVDLPPGASVADAEAALRERLPDAAALLGASAFAVNRAYAKRTTKLNDGDELAVLPPVSGG